MHCSALTILSSLMLTVAQQVGNVQSEVHPKLQWTKCAAEGNCDKINGEVVIDANWRWIHKVDNLVYNCYDMNKWDSDVCGSVEECTNTCALEGATYDKVYGVKTAADTLTAKFKTQFEFSYNIASRLFLLESKNRYQMFTLLNNELAFDVDLSTVECGINSALYFVPMDPDGGQAKYPTNQAGAEYGTGYCDATCPRDLKWIEGKANFESWIPSATDEFSGVGRFGACCPQFSVWNSNAHSFSMSSHVCPDDGFTVCDHYQQNCPNAHSFSMSSHVCPDDGFTVCDHYQQNCQFDELYPDERKKKCDFWGCGYNAYRMGNTDFYGKGKKLDTARKFSVVTQWNETKITQFFIQDGQKIEMPAPVWEGLPKEAGLSADMCQKQRQVFKERDFLAENGGWEAHNRQLLEQPLVMVLFIGPDHFSWNAWLDSTFPPDDPEGTPGRDRGDCRLEDNDPQLVSNMHSRAQVIWSNIRFGPIGSTVKF